MLVRLVATGLCHSDDHWAKGDSTSSHLPWCGGHEGAGIVEAVAPNVRSLKPGDHVVMSFIPRVVTAGGVRAACRTCVTTAR